MEKFYSVLRCEKGYDLVSLETSVTGGLPKVSLVGLSEPRAKETLLKLRSAVEKQGFKWQIEKHIVISISSPDRAYDPLFDLALLAAFLKETKQVKFKIFSKVVFCGELTLGGEVLPCSMSEQGFAPSTNEIWLGNLQESRGRDTVKVKKASDFNKIKKEADVKNEVEEGFKKYQNNVVFLKPYYLKLLQWLVHGEHSFLILRPRDSSFGDFAKSVHQNLSNLSVEQARGVRFKNKQRPYVNIPPSLTRAQILGTSKLSGLHYYGNGGLALGNDIFSLGKVALDALKSLYVGEGFHCKEKLSCMLLAQNTLCPCGKAQVSKPRKCGYSYYKCRSVLERISHQDLLLFQIIVAPEEEIFDMYPHPDHNIDQLNGRKFKAWKTQRKRKQDVPNSQLELLDLKAMMSEDAKTFAYIPLVGGLDRTQAILSFARTLADFEEAEFIESHHIKESLEWTYRVPKKVSSLF